MSTNLDPISASQGSYVFGTTFLVFLLLVNLPKPLHDDFFNKKIFILTTYRYISCEKKNAWLGNYPFQFPTPSDLYFDFVCHLRAHNVMWRSQSAIRSLHPRKQQIRAIFGSFRRLRIATCRLLSRTSLVTSNWSKCCYFLKCKVNCISDRFKVWHVDVEGYEFISSGHSKVIILGYRRLSVSIDKLQYFVRMLQNLSVNTNSSASKIWSSHFINVYL